MTELLSDRVAVVTGGASGIGRAIALAFADHGADVVVADVREEPREGGAPTVERVREETAGRAAFVECDVSDRGDLAAAADRAAEFGPLTTLVNNAGLLVREPFVETDEGTLDAMIDTNLKGTFFGAQVAAERMETGTIVNLSSIAGMVGTAELAGYCATKGAVRLLTYALAAELAPDVRVNALHPGATDTMQAREDSGMVGSPAADSLRERIPMGRFGRPPDVANAAVFLASDLAGYVTGASLVVDGGRYTTA